MIKRALVSCGFLLIIVIGLVACTGKASEGNNESDKKDMPDKISFAVAGVEGLEQLQTQYGELEKLFEELLEVEVELFSLSDRTISSSAMEYGQVDVVLSGPSEYILTKQAEPGIEIVGGIERDNYYTAFVAHKDSGIASLEDMKGKTIAMKDSGSTSGHIGPSSILIEEGFDLDKDFDIQLLGDASLEALRSGEVDVMADGIRQYDALVELDGEDEWRIIYEGEPLPQDPFILSPSLPDEFVEKFKQALFEHEEEILQAILASEENDKYDGARLIELADEDYDVLRNTYKVLGLEVEE